MVFSPYDNDVAPKKWTLSYAARGKVFIPAGLHI